MISFISVFDINRVFGYFTLPVPDFQTRNSGKV